MSSEDVPKEKELTDEDDSWDDGWNLPDEGFMDGYDWTDYEDDDEDTK